MASEDYNLDESVISLDDSISFDLGDDITLDGEETGKPQDIREVDIEAEALGEVNEVLAGFADRARKEQSRLVTEVDTEFYICLCFQTREQKEEYLRKAKLIDLGDKYMDGMKVAKRQGIELTSPVPELRQYRVDPTYAGLSEFENEPDLE